MSLNLIYPNYLSYAGFVGANNTVHTNIIFDTFANYWMTVIAFNGVHWGWSAATKTLYFSEIPNTNYFGSTTINPNQLYRITWTYDGTTDKLYIDGVLEITTTAMTTVSRISTEVGFISGVTTANGTGMNIDGIKIWNTVLSLSEINKELDSIKPQKWMNIWDWLPCNNGGTDGGDYSGNARNFTVNGTITHTAPSSISWGDPSIYFPYAFPQYASPLCFLAC
jgi:hypothetical protein